MEIIGGLSVRKGKGEMGEGAKIKKHKLVGTK